MKFYQNKIKKIYWYLLVVIIIFSLWHIFSFVVQAQSNAISGDAIFIRVIANPHHYSARRWYFEQGFTGAPQARKVDGYDAVVDGRTVYVNAANNVGGNFYTNIYHISYNQNPQKTTLSIFNRMLDRWKFNTNLSNIGTCSISALYCQQDNDCQDDYHCQNNKCVLDKVRYCWSDRECPENIFCDSEKANVTRKTITLGNLADIQKIFQNYIDIHGSLPEFKTGTYIPGVSLSVWPSWQETLSPDLGGGALPIDPINVIGSCGNPGFALATCWNDNIKRYAGGGIVLGSSGMNVPTNSYLYAYVDGNLYVVTGDSYEQMNLTTP